MRLGTKLLISFIAVALLVLLTGGLSYYLSNDIKNELISESRQTTEQLQVLTEMTVQLQNSLLYTRNYVTERNKRRGGDRSNTTASQIRHARGITEESLDDFQAALRFIQDCIPRDSTGENNHPIYAKIYDQANSLDNRFLYYDSLIRELYDLEGEGSYGDEIFNVTIEPYFRNTLFPILLQVRESYNKSVDIQQAELQQRSEQTFRYIFFITILAFIIAVALAYLVYLSIARPVRKMTDAAETIGDGDFSKRIELNTNDELAHFAATFNQMAENLSKSMVSRSYMDNIIQSMGDMLIVADQSGRIELVNHSLCDTLHYSEDELLKLKVWDIISPENHKNLQEVSKKSLAKQMIIETRFISKEGKCVPVILSWSYLNNSKDSEGKRVYAASDITIQKEAEEKISNSLKEKNVMLAEIHHRVKNNLAVISGLLEMQIWNIDGEESVKALRESQLRVHSIALVHEKLYQSENFASIYIAGYVKELVETIASSFKLPEQKIEVEYDFRHLNMTINQAIPFSLLLNESIVNVYKHAFKGKKEGAISISLKKQGGNLELQIMDNGVGVSGSNSLENKEENLGMSIIDTLAKQLEGEYSVTNRPEGGTCFALTFPA